MNTAPHGFAELVHSVSGERDLTGLSTRHSAICEYVLCALSAPHASFMHHRDVHDDLAVDGHDGVHQA
jgi:hypothetical protein